MAYTDPLATTNQLDALLRGIDYLSDQRVRDILREVLTASPHAQQIAAERLLVDAKKKREETLSESEDEISDPGTASGSDEDRSDSSGDEDSEIEYLGISTRVQMPPGIAIPPVRVPQNPTVPTITPTADLGPARPKRVVPRYSFCSNCQQEFDVTENSSKACTYHPLDCEPTGDDLWVDNEFGVEDSPGLRQQYPECYEFECCGDTLEDNPEGCETGWHEEGQYERPKKVYRTYHYQPSF
ncbi:hypothetical protein BJY01DRAFT_213503 [Aspergillus pseudoustus]|uniref:C2H2-type domain-containing protein n=1 Tax=Aspergillus pseudoustus TaxID=1810923 RepID=A0ABR4K1D3_9EURO